MNMEPVEPRGPRRRWSREEKERIVSQAAVAGRSVASVASEYGIGTSLIYQWRRRLGAVGISDHPNRSRFSAVTITSPAAGMFAGGTPGGVAPVEIRLLSGTVVAVYQSADTFTLRNVLAALEIR
jgi:transposase-like protein